MIIGGKGFPLSVQTMEELRCAIRLAEGGRDGWGCPSLASIIRP